MMKLRAKLFLGFGGLLGILTVVSVLSIVVITWYTHAIERVLHENYDSVVYGQRMIDAVDGLTGDAQALVFGERAADEAFTARQAAERASFAENLAKERGNITLPGEGEVAAALQNHWGRYVERLDGVLAGGAGEAERRGAYRVLLEQRDAVKAGAQKIVDMNLENMVSVNGQAKQLASWARTVLYVLLAAGVLLGAVLMAIVARAILLPLKALTASVKEIEAGNLNLIVPARSRDEVGQLAEAFNSMTAKLREFRRTDQAKLLRTQQTTQLAIDSLPDAVAVVSPRGVIELANQTGRRLFNLQPGVPVIETQLGWLSELCKEVLRTQKAQESRGYQAAVQVFDNGTERFFLPHALPIVDEARDLAGITVVLVDVTRLRQLDELKSSLVSTVSHELKTPLTSLRLANHLLLSERIGPLTPKQTEVLVEERENAARLQSIIDNLLDMSRIERGEGMLDTDAAAPHELVNEAVDSLRAAIHDKGIRLALDVPLDLPAVNADATRIHHVLTNLLSNAMRYTPAGGEIRVSAMPAEQAVSFAVADTGVGIPQPFQARVFDKFFRVPGQIPGGAGLGLAIAREIIEAHGGTIEVESRQGKGATFRFTLPRADVRAVQEVHP